MYNPYFQNGFQQYPQNPVTPNVQNDGMNWVQGEAGANAWYVQPGHVAVLFDSTRQVFYIKSCDQMGKPQALEIYDYSAHKDQPAVQQQDLSNYVTKEEMKKYIADLFGGEEKK